MKSIAIAAVVAMFLLLIACTTPPLSQPSDVVPPSGIPEQPAEAAGGQQVAEETMPQTGQEESGEADELLQDDLDDGMADLEQLE